MKSKSKITVVDKPTSKPCLVFCPLNFKKVMHLALIFRQNLKTSIRLFFEYDLMIEQRLEFKGERTILEAVVSNFELLGFPSLDSFLELSRSLVD